MSQCGALLAVNMSTAVANSWTSDVLTCMQHTVTNILSSQINQSNNNQLSLSINCIKYYTAVNNIVQCVMDCLYSHYIPGQNTVYLYMYSLPHCQDTRKLINLIINVPIRSVYIDFPTNHSTNNICG